MLSEDQLQSFGGHCEPSGRQATSAPQRQAIVQSFDNNQYLFKAGETISDVYLIKSGVVSVTRYSTNGDIAGSEYAFSGQFVGPGRIIRNRTSARAELPTTVSVYSPSQWVDLVESDTRLQVSLIAETQREFSDLRDDRIAASRELGLTERIANFLLATSEMAQSEGRRADLWSDEIHIENVAQVLDADLKSTTDAFEPLEDAGAVYSNPGGRLRIDRPDALQSVTGCTD